MRATLFTSNVLLVWGVFLFPVLLHAFVAVPRCSFSSSLRTSSAERGPLRLVNGIEEKEFNIDDILAEAEAALEVANDALESKASSAGSEPPVEPTLLADIPDSSLKAADTQVQSPKKEDKEPKGKTSESESTTSLVPEPTLQVAETKVEPPKDETKATEIKSPMTITTSPVVQESASRLLSDMGDALSGVVKGVVTSAGKSIQSLPNVVSDSVQKQATKVGDAAQQKAQETAEDLSSLPTKLSEVVQQKAEETAQDFASIPQRLSDAAKEKVSDVFGIRTPPTIVDWKQNSNGSVTGKIRSSSKNYQEGETVTTAPIKYEATDGATVETVTGTRYILGKKKAEISEGFFGILGTNKRAFAAEAKSLAGKKRIEAEKKRKLAERARETLTEAKPRATFSLASLFFGREKTIEPVEPILAEAAPRGVPTITKWRQNVDGSISGYVSGSSNFEEGEPVTTSPIAGKAIGAAVVQTQTGSRYYLSKKKAVNNEMGLFGLLGSSFAPFQKD